MDLSSLVEIISSVEIGSELNYLASQLTDIVTKAIFHIPRFMKALLHQLLDPCLGGGTLQGSHESILLRCDLRIGRQAGNVGQALRFRDGLLVER